MAGPTRLDIRQADTRILQDQLNTTATTAMDSTVASINSELTSPGRLIAASTPSLVVTINSGTVVNPNTSKNRVLPLLSNTVIPFTGGTITFPSGTGTITVSAGTSASITIGASQFVPVLVQLDTTGNINLTVGSAFASSALAIAGVPGGSSSFLTLGYIIAQSNGSSVIQNITNAMLYQISGGGSGGSGSGSGTGDDLDALQYNASFTDLFTDLASSAISSVDASAGHTNGVYSSTNKAYALSYDASKTVTGTGTAMTLSGTPAYTVAVGDILRVGTQARRITVVTSQTVYTIESAFTTNPTAAAATVSQAVYTKDINNFAADGIAISNQYTDSVADVLVTYNDTTSGTLYNGTDPANVAYTVSADNAVNFSSVAVREAALSASNAITSTPTSGTNVFLRFFSNKTSGTGTVNLVGYKVFLHRTSAVESGGIQNQAICFTNSVGTPVGCSNPTVVGGKTQIVTTFSFPVGVNVGSPNGSIVVYLNGQKIPRFVNSTLTPDASYTEVSANTIQLDRDYSSQNLSVEIYQYISVVDSNTQNTTNVSAISDQNTQGFQGFVNTTSFIITATTTTGTPSPGTFYSSISNRASMPDLSQDLKPRMGIERISTQTIQLMPNETGSANQPVWGCPNDQFGQVRFVGQWANDQTSNGQGPQASLSTDYVEITFYGTALNLLTLFNSSGFDIRASIDGGAEGSNLSAGNSNVITGRNYSNNAPLNIVKGLTLGVHTVKIRNNVPSGVYFFGFEIINESSSISVPTGVSYVGSSKLVLTALSSFAYSAPVTGSKGGRVLVYHNSDGTVQSAFKPVDASSLNQSATSHANEEVARSHNFREFAAGRSDDFSTVLSTAARAFTLDDGTTTLVCLDVSSDSSGSTKEGLVLAQSANSFITLTFVGTGLDIFNTTTNTATSTFNLIIDGTTVATNVASNTLFPPGCWSPIVSGLAYGVHTVKILQGSTVGSSPRLSDFRIWQMKKPALPSGCVELGDYHALATYVAQSGTQTGNSKSTGVLGKTSMRELIYTGTWGGGVTLNSGDPNGWTVRTTTVGDSYQYTFFGTGFEILQRSGSGSTTSTVAIDGSLYTGAATALNGTGGSGIAAWTAGTGTYTADTGFGSRLIVTGLTLGIHTVKVTTATAANTVALSGIDIITPIYSQKSNLYADLQNTLMIGSNAISDNRKFTPVKDVLPAAKAWAQAVGITQNPTTTSSTNVPMPDMAANIKTGGGAIEVDFRGAFTLNALNTAQIWVAVDGVIQGAPMNQNEFIANGFFGMSNKLIVPVSPGAHQVAIYWNTNGGTLQAGGIQRIMTVKEM